MNRLISNGVSLSDLAQEAEPNPLNERLSVISMVAKLGKAMLVSSIVVRYFHINSPSLQHIECGR